MNLQTLLNLIKALLNRYLSDEQLLVRRIRDGTVLDHLEPGTSLRVLLALNVTGDYSDTVTVAMNVPSGKLGKKDIVKVSNRFLSKEETNRIALFAPRATVNLIRDFKVVEKRSVELPDSFTGVFKCLNPTCVSNSSEPIESSLAVVKKRPILLRCKYCMRIITPQELLQ